MAFFEVLLALAIERLWLSVATWRRFTWFMRLTAWSEARENASASVTHPDNDDAPVTAATNTGERARASCC